jgi:hypothetical protein
MGDYVTASWLPGRGRLGREQGRAAEGSEGMGMGRGGREKVKGMLRDT